MARSSIKVSIISPIYNTPQSMLRMNIEHLMSQTLKDIEIILVDDGSREEAALICDEYAKKDGRIVVIHQQNKGLCGARNAGQRVAKGEFISFVDGDDYIECDALKTMYDCMRGRKIDVVVSCIVKDYGGHCKEFDYSKFDDGRVYEGNECNYLQEKVLDFTANISHTGAKLYRRDFLQENNIEHKENLRQGAEGIEFMVRVFGAANKVLFVKKNVYHYTYNDNSITEKHDESNHDKVIKCFEEIEKEAHGYDNYNEIHTAILKRLQYVLVTTAVSGYFSPSNREGFFAARKKYCEHVGKHPLFIESIKMNNNGLDRARKIILALIKIKFFLPIKFIALLRNGQKKVQ